MKHRGKRIYTMLEEIRKLIRARFDKRFQMLADWDGNVTPFVEKKLKQLELESRKCSNLVLARRRKFDVKEGSINFTVNLGDHYCDYKRWQISSSPYKYAARWILSLKAKMTDCGRDWFHVERYIKLCDAIIHLILDSRC